MKWQLVVLGFILFITAMPSHGLAGISESAVLPVSSSARRRETFLENPSYVIGFSHQTASSVYDWREGGREAGRARHLYFEKGGRGEKKEGVIGVKKIFANDVCMYVQWKEAQKEIVMLLVKRSGNTLIKR